MASISEDFIFWMLGVVGIALALTILGVVTSRHLPPKERRIRISRFALVGLGTVFLCLPIFKPTVSSYSRAEVLDSVRTDNLNSLEDVVKFEKDQSRNIERLTSEVVRLREDIYRVNLYYSMVVQLLSSLLVVLCISLAFRPKAKTAIEIDADHLRD